MFNLENGSGDGVTLLPEGHNEKTEETIISCPRLPRKAAGALEMLKTQLNKDLSNLFQLLGPSCFEKALDLQMSLPPQII